MSEEYRLIKHNENLAEIGNDRGVGLLFLVDEDCERKLGIIVDCLNEKQSTIEAKDKKIAELDQQCADFLGVRIKAQEEWEKCTDKLKEKIVEQQATIERLEEKVTDYEIILSITDDKRTLCKRQQIDDVAFYCERYSDYRCYPLCPNTKDCFEADGTFQEKLKDLKEFWGERWYE